MDLSNRTVEMLKQLLAEKEELTALRKAAQEILRMCEVAHKDPSVVSGRFIAEIEMELQVALGVETGLEKAVIEIHGE